MFCFLLLSEKKAYNRLIDARVQIFSPMRDSEWSRPELTASDRAWALLRALCTKCPQCAAHSPRSQTPNCLCNGSARCWRCVCATRLEPPRPDPLPGCRMWPREKYASSALCSLWRIDLSKYKFLLLISQKNINNPRNSMYPPSIFMVDLLIHFSK